MKFIIIEDEALAARQLGEQLERILPQGRCLAHIASVRQGKAMWPLPDKPDVIFSDVQLTDGLSFELLKHWKPLPCPVIFITAFSQFALEAFRIQALDYLLKPLSDDDLRLAIDRVKARLEPISQSIDYDALARAIRNEETKWFRRYLIKVGNKFITVESPEIACLFVEHKTTMALQRNGKTYPLDKSLEVLATDLNPDQFFRINRMTLVQRSSIVSMTQESKGRVRLTLSPQPPESVNLVVSTERSPLFKQWIELGH